MALTQDERKTIEAAIELIAAKDLTVSDHPDILGDVSIPHLIVKRTYDEGEVPVGVVVFGLLNAVEIALTMYAEEAGITREEARENLLASLREMLREETT